MIKIIAGGKKSSGWVATACAEYAERLRKPYDVQLECYDEEKLAKLLEKWPWGHEDFVIVLDERGANINSPELAQILEQNFTHGRNVIMVIGGAYGVSAEARARANLVWSFSKLVFPHLLMRVMTYEQIYRAQEIAHGGKYHHE